MFYPIYEELCRLRGESPSRAAEHMGLNRATVTFWKKEGFCPRRATLAALADYFAVPAAHLMGERVRPCPVCGGGETQHEVRHARVLAAAEKYGLYWPEPLCRKRLSQAREQLLQADADDNARIAAVRTALTAQFCRSLAALDFPPDHPSLSDYIARSLLQAPPEDWLTAEELAYLCEVYPPPADRTAPCRIPPTLFDDPQPPTADNILPLPVSASRIPVLGRIAAGNPVVAAEEVEGWLPSERGEDGEYFALRVKGDSMIGAGIPDGALVILKRRSDADDGQIAACMVDGGDATLKRIRRDGAHIVLCPENPAYAPRVLPLSAFETGEARILGVAVEVRTYLG